MFASDGKRREEEAVVASVAATGERGRNKREKSRGVYVREQKQRLRQRILYLGVRGLDGDVRPLVAKRRTRCQLRKNELAGISSFGGLDSDAEGGPGGEVIGQWGSLEWGSCLPRQARQLPTPVGMVLLEIKPWGSQKRHVNISGMQREGGLRGGLRGRPDRGLFSRSPRPLWDSLKPHRPVCLGPSSFLVLDRLRA